MMESPIISAMLWETISFPVAAFHAWTTTDVIGSLASK